MYSEHNYTSDLNNLSSDFFNVDTQAELLTTLPEEGICVATAVRIANLAPNVLTECGLTERMFSATPSNYNLNVVAEALDFNLRRSLGGVLLKAIRMYFNFMSWWISFMGEIISLSVETLITGRKRNIGDIAKYAWSEKHDRDRLNVYMEGTDSLLVDVIEQRSDDMVYPHVLFETSVEVASEIEEAFDLLMEVDKVDDLKFVSAIDKAAEEIDKTLGRSVLFGSSGRPNSLFYGYVTDDIKPTEQSNIASFKSAGTNIARFTTLCQSVSSRARYISEIEKLPRKSLANMNTIQTMGDSRYLSDVSDRDYITRLEKSKDNVNRSLSRLQSNASKVISSLTVTLDRVSESANGVHRNTIMQFLRSFSQLLTNYTSMVNVGLRAEVAIVKSVARMAVSLDKAFPAQQ